MKKDGTILWLTGWGMPSSIWDSWQQSLTEYYHVAVDFSQVASPSAIYQEVEEIYRGIQQEIPSPILVVGWSLGGMLAQRLAATFPVQGLLLLNTTARFVRDETESHLGWPTTSLIRIKRSVKKSRYEVLERFYTSMFPESEKEFSHESSITLLQQCSWTENALLAGLDILLSEDCRPLLSHINCPCLLVHSFNDPVIPYAAAQEMAESIPNATFISPDYQGHYPFVSGSSYVVNEIRRFIRAK